MRYLTKDWYIACQTDPMTPEVQKRLDEIDRAYCAAQTREALPDGLLRRFFFHDGAVREIITGTDLTLRIDSPYSEYHTVTFRSAKMKQEPPCRRRGLAVPGALPAQERARLRGAHPVRSPRRPRIPKNLRRRPDRHKDHLR